MPRRSYKQANAMAFCPQANYTGRMTAAKLVPIFLGRGFCMVSATDY
jgi:hypothetical protein